MLLLPGRWQGLKCEPEYEWDRAGEYVRWADHAEFCPGESRYEDCTADGERVYSDEWDLGSHSTIS